VNHLTVPAYCAFAAGFCLALLARAIQTVAHTFTAVFLVAALYFAWRAVVETRKNWPAFKAEMRRRNDARRRAAQQKRYPYNDTH
jgi:threonine/homoserine/homoserine lactone efflux protein